MIQNGTGTILHPRKTKERLPLSVVLKDPPKYDSYCYNRISNPIPLANYTNVNNRHTVYKAMETVPNFSKSGQLFTQKSFTPAVPFKEISLEKKVQRDFDPNENRMVASMTPPESSIDFSVKQLSNACKDYYTKKKAQKYMTNESHMDSMQHNRMHSQLYNVIPTTITQGGGVVSTRQPLAANFSFPPYTHSHPHPHSHPQNSLPSRYPSPPSLPSAQSGESIGLPDARSYCFEPPYSPANYGHLHTPSIDLHYHKSRIPLTSAYDQVPSYTHGYEGGTFPRKKENQRFRIPSNPSVTSKSSIGKLSTGSIERTSERGSPMPTFHVEVLSPGTGGSNSCSGTVRGSISKRASMPEYCYTQPRPAPGELRRVHIDKSVEPLGIQISCLDSGGVFVSTVTEHSLASQVGLQIGDQLLEVCGINMRSATYQLAANVLRQCGNSITMLVQYSPDSEYLFYIFFF